MTRKCHNHILQTKPWHREEESKNDNNDMTFRTQTCKATSFLFPSGMITKLEKTQSTATQSKDLTQPPSTHTMGATTNNG